MRTSGIDLFRGNMDEVYQKLGTEIGALVEKKNKAYGSTFDKCNQILEVLYPYGVDVDKYDDFLAITRVVDKLFRIATDKDAFNEDPWMDIAGYGLLGAARKRNQKKEYNER
jgi:tRNA A37 threonylcarbamoyltransferase TsaD